MIRAESVFDFRERTIGRCVRVFRCRKGARKNEVEEFDGERIMERRTNEERHL